MSGSGETGNLKISQLPVAEELFGADIVPIIRAQGDGYENLQGALSLLPQGAEDLSQLGDCNISSPENDQFLVYTGSASKWENKTVSSVPSFNGQSGVAIELIAGSGVTLTPLESGQYEIAASGESGGGGGNGTWIPITWNSPANGTATESPTGVWALDVTNNSPSPAPMLSDISVTLAPGDRLQIQLASNAGATEIGPVISTTDETTYFTWEGGWGWSNSSTVGLRIGDSGSSDVTASISDEIDYANQQFEVVYLAANLAIFQMTAQGVTVSGIDTSGHWTGSPVTVYIGAMFYTGANGVFYGAHYRVVRAGS